MFMYVPVRRRGAKRVEEVFDEDGNVVYGSPTGPNNADGDIRYLLFL